jgi:hypothetical protein
MMVPDPSRIVMRSPGVPLPVIGVVVGFHAPVAVGAVMVGAVGAVELTVSGRLVGVLWFPAGSVAVIERVCGPFGSAGDGVTEYDPVGSTTVVPMMVPEAFLMVMVSPGVPLPVMVGVESEVANGAVVSHPTDPGVDGADGGVVSTIGVRGVELLVQLVGTIGSHALTVIGSGVDGIAVVGIE